MSTSTTELSRTQVANALAERCADAYSADRYRSWRGVAVALLAAGYDERQAEAIMRSKWARWAADRSAHPYGKTPAKVLVEYAEEQPLGTLYDLTRETFGDEVQVPHTYNEHQREWHCLWCSAPLREGENCRKQECIEKTRRSERRMGVSHPTDEPSRSVYTESIKERLDKMGRSHGVDPRHVEAWMRLEHPTLDGLDPRQFTREVALAIACIDASTDQENEACARSFGL